MNVVSLRRLPALSLAALLLTACPSQSSNTTGASDAATDGRASASAIAPLSSAPPLPAPSSLPASGMDAGTRGGKVVYAQTRGPDDGVKLVGVNRDLHRALLEVSRKGSDAPVQLVTVDFVGGTAEDVWSPSQALPRILDADDARGPALADALDAGTSFRADLVGWAQRLARGGPPRADGTMATAPGARFIAFASGRYLWLAGADGAAPRALSPFGEGSGEVLSPDGTALAWWSVVDHVNAARPRLLVAKLTGGGNPTAVNGITDPASVTFGRNSLDLYMLASTQVDGGKTARCLHMLDLRLSAPKRLACVTGADRGLALSPDGRLAVVSSHPPDATKPATDVAMVSLPEGTVKRQIRIPLDVAGGGLVDDKGLFVTVGSNAGTYVATIDGPTGALKAARYADDPLAMGDWVGPRAFVVLRTTRDAAVLERIDVDGLTAAKLP